MSRFLVVTADDFGLHEAVNEAVETASRGGILTAASLMVAAPAAADAVRRARALPELRVGLHLTLADAAPASPASLVPGLVDAHGRFGSAMVRDGLRYFLSRELRRQLAAEIRAQFSAFARTGLALDHVNAHKHFHVHPTLLGLVLRIGAEFGAPAVRVPAEPLWFAAASAALPGWVAAAALAPWTLLMKQRLRSAGVAFSDHVFGIGASGAMHEQRLLEVLARLPDGLSEIYLHPATRTGLTASMSTYRHDHELAALLSPRVRAALQRTGVRTGGYRDAIQLAGARTA